MTLNIVKGSLFGTDVIINGERKHTYGYKFTKIFNKKGECTLWYSLLVYLFKHKPCASHNDVYAYINGIKHNKKTSNHDLLAALKNCGLVSYVRGNKTTYWFITDKGKEYINEIINN